MTSTLTGRTTALLLAAALTGCSPALNWRTVRVADAGLSITLPCKPDRATRQVELAGTPVDMSMVGCEADDSTFAVSYVTLPHGQPLGTALTHWRAAVLANLGPDAAATATEAPYAPSGGLPVPQSVHTVAHGKRGDGTAVVAEAVWFARASGPRVRLYHAVVYGTKARPEVARQFFTGMVLS